MTISNSAWMRKGFWLTTGVVALTMGVTACSKKKNSDGSAGASPIAEKASQHKADQCPKGLEGNYVLEGHPNVKVWIKTENGVYTMGDDEFSLPVNGQSVNDDRDKSSNIAICKDGKIEMTQQGPEVENPNSTFVTNDKGIEMTVFDKTGKEVDKFQFTRVVVAAQGNEIQEPEVTTGQQGEANPEQTEGEQIDDGRLQENLENQ